MPIKFESTGPAVTADTVSAFEAALPGRLPDDYRDFLRTTNGGRPEPNWLPPERPGESLDIAEFLGLDVSEYSRSLVQTRQVFTDRIPDHLLAVASANGSTKVCVSLSGDDRGSVWFYDTALEVEPEDGQDPDLLVRLFDSFTEFFAALEPAPELEEMIRRLKAANPAFRAPDLT